MFKLKYFLVQLEILKERQELADIGLTKEEIDAYLEFYILNYKELFEKIIIEE